MVTLFVGAKQVVIMYFQKMCIKTRICRVVVQIITDSRQIVLGGLCLKRPSFTPCFALVLFWEGFRFLGKENGQRIDVLGWF